jgi:hypothetical protein
MRFPLPRQIARQKSIGGVFRDGSRPGWPTPGRKESMVSDFFAMTIRMGAGPIRPRQFVQIWVPDWGQMILSSPRLANALRGIVNQRQ